MSSIMEREVKAALERVLAEARVRAPVVPGGRPARSARAVPMVGFSLVSGFEDADLSGDAMANYRVTVTAWAWSRGDAVAIIDAVCARFRAGGPVGALASVTCELVRDLPGDDARTADRQIFARAVDLQVIEQVNA